VDLIPASPPDSNIKERGKPVMADPVSSGEVLSALLLSGLMGLLGQGVRAAVGLKSSRGTSSDPPNQQTAFSAAYFSLSLMIGFTAGVLAGLVVGVDHLLSIDPANMKVLLGIAARVTLVPTLSRIHFR
jgi:hypothetical protein